MEINENNLSAAGGLLGGIAGAWMALAAFVRRIKSGAEWKGRMETAVEQNSGALARLEDKVDAGFNGIHQRIDQWMSQGGTNGAR